MLFAKTVLISPSTLSASYGANTAVIEVHPNINDIILYFGYKAGTSADTLNAVISFSPDNTLYFDECTDEVGTTSTKLIKKVYTFADVAGATANVTTGEYVGDLTAADVESVQTYLANKMRLKTALPPLTGSTPVVRHDGTAFGSTTERANDAAFTSIGLGIVEWSLTTGNLNFNTTDLASYNGQKITVDYTTRYNLFRTVIPAADHYLRVSLKETAAGVFGTGFCWLSYGSNFK